MRKRATPVTWEQIKRAAFCREYCRSTRDNAEKYDLFEQQAYE